MTLMTTHSLSGVLRSLRLSSAVLWRAHLTGRWGVHTRGLTSGAMLFHGVVAGRAFVTRDADGRAHELGPGDVVVLPRADPHAMTSEAGGHAVPISQLSRNTTGKLPMLEYGTRGDLTQILCGTFQLDHPARPSIVDLLPGAMVATPRAAPVRTWTQATLALLEGEIEREGPSGRTTSLADALFAHVLSEAAGATDAPASGLLAAARDEQIGRALALVHGDPSQDWSAARLATQIGMSRTRFFDRFSELVGEPPARYVVRWRVHAAADLLRRGSLSMTEVAEKVGYSSEDALARAFKRHVGVGPGEYRRKSLAAPH